MEETSASAKQTLASTRASLPNAPPGGELERGDLMGRYVIVGVLGAGAMGVVYAAYDPELDRKVALKIMRPRGADGESVGRTRLIREAQALARLGHPNVVAVHDVGERDGTVWLAMELVEGRTLGEWVSAEDPTWDLTLRVLVEAARGVAAAHAVGLVHRDLKPDNVMVGVGGRVRVMDFGLARAGRDADDERAPTGSESALRVDVTRVGAIVGTPAYMAPEQFSGLEADARSDQFGWCAMAWEALFRERPFAGESLPALALHVAQGRVREPGARRGVPGWLRGVLERGLSAAPGSRHASMQALLDELERRRHAGRRARVLGAGGLLLAGLLSIPVVGLLRERARETDCAAQADTIEVTWPGPRGEMRERLERALQVTGDGSTFGRALSWLEAWTDEWKEARVETCASADDDSSGDAGAIRCLDARRQELEALLSVLAEGDAAVALRTVPALAQLTRPAACRDPAVLAHFGAGDSDELDITELRRDLVQGRGLLAAGRYLDGLSLTQSVVERAEAVGAAAMVVEARLQACEALEKAGRPDEAEAACRRVMGEAGAARMDELAADAAMDLLLIVNGDGRRAEALVWGEVATMLVERVREADGLRGARLWNNLAIVHRGGNEFERAQQLHERALAIRERELGEAHPDVAASLSNLAIVFGSRGELSRAAGLHERALALREAALGPNHPDVAVSLTNLAAMRHQLEDIDGAEALLVRAIQIRERTLGPKHPQLAGTLNNLALAQEAQGRAEQALETYARVLQIVEGNSGPEHPNVAHTLNNMALVHYDRGDHARALALHERALAIREAALEPDDPDVAQSLANKADALRGLGRDTQALPLYERALALREKSLGGAHPLVARSSLDLALARLAMGRHREAIVLLERAIAIGEASEWSERELANAREALVRARAQAGAGAPKK